MAFWYTKRSINISVRVCSILRFAASLFTTNGWAEGAGLSAQLLLYTMRCYVLQIYGRLAYISLDG